MKKKEKSSEEISERLPKKIHREPWRRGKDGFSPATRMRKIREDSGLSRRALAFELEVSLTTIQNYEEGRLPSSEYLVKFSDFFDCSIDWLLTGELRSPIHNYLMAAVELAGAVQIDLNRIIEPDLLAEMVSNSLNEFMVGAKYEDIFDAAKHDYFYSRIQNIFIELYYNTNAYSSDASLSDEAEKIAGKPLKSFMLEDYVKVESHFIDILGKCNHNTT